MGRPADHPRRRRLFETDRHSTLVEEVHHVADELGLPRSWLNEQATMYAPADYRSGEGTVFDGANLRVAAASAEVVLAMKVRAARASDVADIRFLVGYLGVRTLEAVIEVHDRYFPGDQLPEAKALLVEDILRSP